jgi:hypothetical protein
MRLKDSGQFQYPAVRYAALQHAVLSFRQKHVQHNELCRACFPKDTCTKTLVFFHGGWCMWGQVASQAKRHGGTIQDASMTSQSLICVQGNETIARSTTRMRDSMSTS